MALRLILAAGAIAAALLGLTGCGYLSAGPNATEDRAVPGDLSDVVLAGTGTLTVTPGDPALQISAGQNTLDRIRTTERGGALHLDLDGGFFNSPGPIDYALSLPTLDAVTVEGAGEVTASAPAAETLDVQISGAGDVLVTDVDAEQVTVRIDGTGTVRLRGQADQVDVRVDGAGEFRGDQLITRTAVATIEGAGDIEVHATQTLDATISGAGIIRHSGGAEVSRDIDGVGEIVSD